MDNTLYTDESIESLSPREHVRLRSGMYIGSTESPMQLALEILANAIDEHNIGRFYCLYIRLMTNMNYWC